MTAPRIAYDDAGHGEPALLLMPGWCGGRDLFDDLLPLVARSRRSVALDWRGHGDSEQASQDFGGEELLADATTVIDSLGLQAVVPVAVSHAGWVAIELRRRLGPGRVPGIALLDWMVLGTPPGFADALAGMQQPEAWQAVRAALFGRWTDGVDLPALTAYVDSMATYGFEAWSRAGREIAAAFAAQPVPLEALAALTPPCPTLHVYAQPRDDGYLAAQQAFAAANPWFSVQRIDAQSHLPMLEDPEAVAGALAEFAAALPA